MPHYSEEKQVCTVVIEIYSELSHCIVNKKKRKKNVRVKEHMSTAF